MNSSRTTWLGISSILTALGLAGNLYFDGDPKTMPDWNLVIPQILAGVGLVMARDNNKSSEDVGIKPK